MRATAEMAKSIINSDRGIDTLLAVDAQSGDNCGYCGGTPQQLCDYIDHLELNSLVPYKVKLSNSTVDTRRGEKAGKDKPFILTLAGRSGGQVNGTPANGYQHPAQAPGNAAVPLELAKEAEGNAVRNGFLVAQVDELKKQVDQLVRERDEADEEAEEAEQLLNAAPPPPPMPFWNTEAGGKALIEAIAPIGKALGAFVGNGFKAPKPVQATAAEVSSYKADGLTEEDRRILIAVKNYKATGDPDAEAMVATLLDQYAAIPEPAKPTPDA